MTRGELGRRRRVYGIQSSTPRVPATTNIMRLSKRDCRHASVTSGAREHFACPTRRSRHRVADGFIELEPAPVLY
jgi:hypothetical protein